MSKHLEIDDGELRRDDLERSENFERLQPYLGSHKTPDPFERSERLQQRRVFSDHADQEGLRIRSFLGSAQHQLHPRFCEAISWRRGVLTLLT